MGFFEDIFGEALPEGTPAGNLLRKALNETTGGVLGNGAAKISQIDYDLQKLTDQEYIAKYGKTKAGIPVPNVVPNPEIMAVDQQLRTGVNAKSGFWITFKSLAKRYWFFLLIPVGFSLLWLLGKVFNLDKKQYSSKRKKR